MNAIGNDNYRPGMTPPAPMKRSSGWLSSNMAQLMVFLNGLILTVTAYATLSVFIQEIVKEDFLKITAEVQEHISSSYEKLDDTLSTVNSFLQVVPSDKKNTVIQYAKTQIPGIKNFEEIFWVQLTAQGGSITPILNNSDFQGDWKKSIARYRVAESQKNNFFVIEDRLLPKSDLGLYKDVFAVVKRINNSRTNYVVGLFNGKDLIPRKWLEDRESIFDLQMMSVKDEMPVFGYQANANNNAIESNAKNYTSLFKLSFADDVYDVKLSLKIAKREAFLQKIPLLMLLFGMTLTLIGTLYVRNNQSQSQKLSSMNKELAHKNYELHQEMSERERLNTLMQTSAMENKAIINAVSDIIFELSDEGTILFLNEAWSKITGFQPDRSIGRNLFDLIYTQDQEEQKENFKKLVTGHSKSYRAFTRLRCADGKYRTIEIAFSMLRQDENKDLRAVGTITDVEERRRAERALGEAEKKYRTIVENSASGIYQVTPEGQFLSANPSFAKIVGYDSAEEILRDVNRAQEQIYVDAALRDKTLQEVAVLGHSKRYEVQVKRNDGNIIWVSENIRPVLDDDGTLLFYEGSMEDIDQRRKAELALKDAKTESDLANRAKSEFLTNMSHELRTPLNSVIGFAEIIKNEAYGALPGTEYKEYATSIFDSGKRLLNVINEILDVSQIEAGDRDLKEGIVNIKDVVGSCLGMMKSKADAKKIRIDNKAVNDTINVVGEKHAIKQMLLNLMSNAIRFSPDSSYILVDAEIDNEGRLRLSITDTGIGLTESELEKALSPFGQVSTEHKRDKSGTGLGLTLVKSLIELHGGGLEMVSQKNIGTTATLTFPEKRVSKPAQKEADKAPASTPSENA